MILTVIDRWYCPQSRSLLPADVSHDRLTSDSVIRHRRYSNMRTIVM